MNPTTETPPPMPVGSQQFLRDLNTQRLVDAVERLGPSSQAELARASGLSRATVNNIVKRLNDRGVLTVTAGANARSTTVALRARGGVAVAFEVGHQHIRGLAVSLDDRRQVTVDHHIQREHAGKPDVERILRTIPELLARLDRPANDLLGVTIVAHAPLDAETGRVSPSAGLRGWAGFDVRRAVAGRLDVPVFVENDVNVAALAERRFGGAGENFAFVKVSEGLGAGLIIGGELYRGPNGMAGQLAHVSVDERGPLCACGNRGCLAAVASGLSLRAVLAAAGRDFASVGDLVAAADEGDPMCGGVLTEAARHVGVAVSHLIKITGMRSVIIGGEMAASERFFVNPLRRMIETQTLRSPDGTTQVSRSGLPESVSLLGGIQVVLDHVGGLARGNAEWLVFADADTPSPSELVGEGAS